MALVFAPNILELTNTTGTTDFTLAGAVTNRQPFSSFMSNSDVTFYAARNGGQYEYGFGTYSSGVLQRTKVLTSSNGNAKVNFTSTGTLVFCPSLGFRPYGTPVLLTSGSGNWARPAWCAAARATNTGAGGGGGAANSDGTGGEGGSAGGTAIKFMLATELGDSVAYSVGTGGGTASAGGNTTFGSLTGTGGSGGASSLSASSTSNPPSGGGASGGDVNLIGGPGGAPIVVSGVPASGQGGASYWGPGGKMVKRGSTSASGQDGQAYGAGGSGGARFGTPNASGGQGAAGVIHLELFY